ncbi:hypothetical protein TVAG_030410 [Trichomonas vaginalis G3]|uniref:Uncharacterized protein n=1 Tax=Trichomonas vaginalis (strain ATCC PRA-98 / G3) TaxID=412133 RepID=A2EY80_TRIV3|nr:mRNA splice site selection [Trichomonas vaginalis G3]EAY02368.1 hypothetical protein TVAG_030410 [Trichomonas vaginalis G3]KAI5501209.1 mRNA splice site selection [Trichomonas vaginalis G3]|eukprot:XP_001314668.1 hypothetical protein [Trichomonas vaginalis G3]
MNGKKYTSYKYGMFEKMLDEWLGVDRNGDNSKHLITSYEDPRVCKYSLAGCCPFSLLDHTRMSKGPCKFEVCPCPCSLKEKYIADNKGFTTNYDQQLFEILDSIIIDANKRITVSKNYQQSKSADVQINPELRDLDTKIDRLMRSSREHGLAGEVLRAMSEMNEAQLLVETRKSKEQELLKNSIDKEQKIHICDVCTAVIQRADMDNRMEDHVLGRQHQAYVKIRETYEMLKSQGLVSKKHRSGPGIPIRSRMGAQALQVRRLVPLDLDC